MATWQVVGIGGFVWLLLIGLGFYVALQKGRPAAEGIVLAFLFGPLGVIVGALLPTLDDAHPTDDGPDDDEADEQAKAARYLEKLQSSRPQ